VLSLSEAVVESYKQARARSDDESLAILVVDGRTNIVLGRLFKGVALALLPLFKFTFLIKTDRETAYAVHSF
jgi:hypothetical protein